MGHPLSPCHSRRLHAAQPVPPASAANPSSCAPPAPQAAARRAGRAAHAVGRPCAHAPHHRQPAQARICEHHGWAHERSACEGTCHDCTWQPAVCRSCAAAGPAAACSPPKPPQAHATQPSCAHPSPPPKPSPRAAVYGVPTSPGRCRALVRQPFKFKSKLVPLLFRLLPEWWVTGGGRNRSSRARLCLPPHRRALLLPPARRRSHLGNNSVLDEGGRGLWGFAACSGCFACSLDRAAGSAAPAAACTSHEPCLLFLAPPSLPNFPPMAALLPPPADVIFLHMQARRDWGWRNATGQLLEGRRGRVALGLAAACWLPPCSAAPRVRRCRRRRLFGAAWVPSPRARSTSCQRLQTPTWQGSGQRSGEGWVASGGWHRSRACPAGPRCRGSQHTLLRCRPHPLGQHANSPAACRN